MSFTIAVQTQARFFAPVWVLIVQGTDVTSRGHRGGRGGVDPYYKHLSGPASAKKDLVKARSNRLLPCTDRELQEPGIIRVKTQGWISVAWLALKI